MPAPTLPIAPQRRRSRLRLGVGVLLVCVVACVACESLLRYSLFGDSAFAQRLGARTRHPGLFATPNNDDLYWILSHKFRASQRSIPGPDAILGWRGKKVIHRLNFGHRDMLALDGRHPILFFGDSFTACVTPREDCWQGLLEASPLGERSAILNYGVGGYGLDQIYLMQREVLARQASWTETHRPTVIVGIMVDDDLDRTVLTFREWPKPRFELDGDELVFQPPNLAATGEPQQDPEPEVFSYAWRYLVFGSKLLPAGLRSELMGTEAGIETKKKLCARLIQEIQTENDARGLDSFFVLFPGPITLGQPELEGWQERLLLDTFGQLGVRFVNAKTDLRADMQRTGQKAGAYFGTDRLTKGHYTVEANSIAMQAVLRGLAGADDGALE